MALGDSSPIGQLNKQQAQTPQVAESFSAAALSVAPSANASNSISLSQIATPVAAPKGVDARLTLHRNILISIVLFVLLVVLGLYERTLTGIIWSKDHPAIYASANAVYEQALSIGELLGFDTKSSDPVKSLSSIAASDTYFPYAKLQIQHNLDLLSTEFVQIEERLDAKKQEVAEFGFVSADVQNILLIDGQKVALQRSLLALEAVKFAAALKVFPYLQSFVSGLADYTATDQAVVDAQLALLDAESDDLLAAYLSMCYVNPLESDASCAMVGDFTTWVSTQTRYATNLDIVFFSKLMHYIDLKLEDTQFPQFALKFQRYDPGKSTLTFSIEVNTFQEDELSLTQRGIQNPHTFIVTSVINLLKKSQFIVWSSVDTKQIQVRPKVVTIGSQELVVNNSVMQFTLPVQERVQREIFDAAP
jgi:hypothetical protein